jgi:hypothetical protein
LVRGAGAQSKSPFHDPLTFLEYAHSIGAGGVQVGIGARDADYTRKLRERTEALGVYLEGQTSLPRDEGDVARFETEVRVTKDSGATVMRTAMLSGRRYETFDSAEAFRQFAARSWKSLTLAEPVVKKHGIRLAIENHKRLGSWTRLLDMLRRYQQRVCRRLRRYRQQHRAARKPNGIRQGVCAVRGFDARQSNGRRGRTPTASSSRKFRSVKDILICAR